MKLRCFNPTQWKPSTLHISWPFRISLSLSLSLTRLNSSLSVVDQLNIIGNTRLCVPTRGAFVLAFAQWTIHIFNETQQCHSFVYILNANLFFICYSTISALESIRKKIEILFYIEYLFFYSVRGVQFC